MSALDPSKDPDRYDADKDVPSPSGLDRDPDRRDYLAFLYGLASVFAFLVLVTVLLSLRG